MTATLLPRPQTGDPVAWRFPVPQEHQLGNGIRVLAVHLPGKQVACVTAIVDLPADADPAGQEGLATLSARCLRLGTASYDEGAFAEALEQCGASFNAGAGYDGLLATLQVPVSRFADALPLLAEAVTTPSFPAAEVDRVVRQRLTEINQERSGPPSRANIEFSALLYPAEFRNAIPLGGTADTVGGLDAAAMADCYAAHAAASTTTLLVAGDLSELDLPALLAASFGGWDSTGTAWVPTIPTYHSRRALVVDRPGSVQTQLVLGHGAAVRSHHDWPAMTLAGYCLGGTLTSRIDAVLREEKGYTYGMRAAFNANRASGNLAISGSVDTGNTAPALADLHEVLTVAREEGLRADEVEAAKQYLVGVSPMRWETPVAVVSQLAQLVGNDLPLSWTDSYLEGMRTAGVDEVNAAQQAHVHPDDLVVVAVGEASAITGPLEELGLTATVVSA